MSRGEVGRWEMERGKEEEVEDGGTKSTVCMGQEWCGYPHGNNRLWVFWNRTVSAHVQWRSMGSAGAIVRRVVNGGWHESGQLMRLQLLVNWGSMADEHDETRVARRE